MLLQPRLAIAKECEIAYRLGVSMPILLNIAFAPVPSDDLECYREHTLVCCRTSRAVSIP